MSRRIRRRARKQNQRRALIIGGIVLVAVLAIFLIRYFSVKSAVDKVADNAVGNNITIDGIDVSGQTADEVKETLNTQLKEYRAQKITFIADGTETVVTLGDLGLSIANVDKVVQDAVSYGKKGSVWKRHQILKDLEKEAKNYEMSFAIDLAAVETTVSKKIPPLSDCAVNATIKRENGTFVITDGRSGKKVDIAESVNVVKAHFNETWKPKANETITLITVVDEPDIKT